jgi:uncharacterized oxidoreductase
MNLIGANIFVTGGGSGIGLSLVRALAARGAQVVTCGRRADRLGEARASVPGLRTFVADLSTAAGVAQAVAALETEMPDLDVLVNNAGAMRVLDLTTPGDAVADERELFTNLTAPVLLARALLPHLLGRSRAAVVNITSGAALVPMPAAPLYSAAKAGLRSFTRSLRRQLSASNVLVVEVEPPLVDTEMRQSLAGTGRSMKRMSAETCAERIVEGLERDRTELLLGDNALLRWADRLVPGFALAQMSKL